MRWKFVALIIFITAGYASAQWEYGGIQISGDNYFTGDLTAISDGNTGIFAAWRYYPQQFDPDIYVQHLDSAGYELWPHGGVPAVIEPHGQYGPRLALDGCGGVIIAWFDIGRNGADYDIYAQRMNVGGQRLWGDSGRAVVVRDGHQMLLSDIVADDQGGALLTWADEFWAYTDTMPVMVQRIDSTGNVLFCEYGMGVTPLQGFRQHSPSLLGSSDGNFIVCWGDDRPDGAGPGIYAQKFSALGEILWDSNGVPVVVNSASYGNLKFGATSWGGLYCVWVSSGGIYFQWLDALGRTGYGLGGILKVEETSVSSLQFIVDADSGALAVWLHDVPYPQQYAAYASFLDTTGTLLHWYNLPIVATDIGTIFSLTQTNSGEFEFGANYGGSIGLRAYKYSFALGLLWEEHGVPISCIGCFSGYRPLGVSDMLGGSFFAWHTGEGYPIKANRVYPDGWVVDVVNDDVTKPERLALFAYPNPFNSSVIIEMAGRNMGNNDIEIFDIRGALVKRIRAENGKAVWHAIDQRDRSVRSGIYFVRIHEHEEVMSLKVIYIK